MKKFLIGVSAAALAFAAGFCYGGAAHAKDGGYWNRSGMSVTHSTPEERIFKSFDDYNAHDYSDFRWGARYGNGHHASRVLGHDPQGAAQEDDTRAPVDWDKGCRHSCLDLSGEKH